MTPAETKAFDEQRWVVFWIDGDGSDEWQLMFNSERNYFATEAEAIAFAETKKIRNKKEYWQPRVSKQKKILKTVTTEEWKIV